jgi:hypothetical protein
MSHYGRGLVFIFLAIGVLAALREARAEPSGDEKTKIAAYAKELKNKNAEVRKQVALALAALGPKAREAVPALRDALLDKDDEVKAAVATALYKILAADRKNAALEGELTRLMKENKLLQEELRQREKKIANDIERLKKATDQAVMAETTAKTLRERNIVLVKQVESLKKLAALEAGKVQPKASAKNPPKEQVKGTITAVQQNGLVEVSLGTDSGVNVGHTLEVYRLKPKAEYLGTIIILDALKTKAVGRILKPQNGARQSPIQKGDEVASRIEAR